MGKLRVLEGILLLRFTSTKILLVKPGSWHVYAAWAPCRDCIQNKKICQEDLVFRDPLGCPSSVAYVFTLFGSTNPISELAL